VEKRGIKVGFAPVRRAILSREAAGRQKQLIEAKLEEWNVDYIGLDWLNEEGLLYDPLDVQAVADRFRAEGVEALFTPHCNFGTETAVALLARALNKPLVLWGPRDEAPTPDGRRDRDTQCGLFASSKALRRVKVPFTYIVNSRADSLVFKRGLDLFLRAATAAKAFLGARIGQISTRPAPFWTTMCNESELLEKWNIQLVPITLVDIEKLVTEQVAQQSPSLKETIAEFRATADFGGVPEEYVARLAGLKLTLVELAELHQLSAFAIQCWSALQQALQIRPCFVNGVLAESGLPVACETDIHGALTSILAQAAALHERPTFFADLTIRGPKDDNTELLWHCGCFPPSLAANHDVRGIECFAPSVPISEQAAGADAPRYAPAAGRWAIQGGDVTLARFDGDQGSYSLFIGEALGVQGPMTRGTYLWIKVPNWAAWEERLVYGPYIHHCVGVHGRLAPVLYEACKYIPGLEPDPMDPTLEEIRAYWRGDDLAEK
jgi:L-fucose isomerase-like protein